MTALSPCVGWPQPALRLFWCPLTDNITAQDLCLDPEVVSGPPKAGLLSRLASALSSAPQAPPASQRVTFVRVYEDAFYTVGVFCMAQGSVLPLHDHPGVRP